MNWNELNYSKKGFILGVIVSFLLILASSYSAPLDNYNLYKLRYEGYKSIIQNCGDNPSDECVAKLCVGRDARGFCEAIYMPREGTTWRTYVSAEKPDISELLVPNIGNGLELFLMFGIFGVIFLFLPPIAGFVIGRRYQRSKN